MRVHFFTERFFFLVKYTFCMCMKYTFKDVMYHLILT